MHQQAQIKNNKLAEKQQDAERRFKEAVDNASNVNEKSDAYLIESLHKEFRDVVRRLQAEQGSIFLVDVLQEMNFLNTNSLSGVEASNLSNILRQQRNNLIVGNGRVTLHENDEILKNLFKILCSILNLKPI